MSWLLQMSVSLNHKTLAIQGYFNLHFKAVHSCSCSNLR